MKSAKQVAMFCRLLLAVVAATMCGSAAAACMEEALDRAQLIWCAKSELVPLEIRADEIEEDLHARHAGDTPALARLDAAKRAWNAARDARCVAEGEKALADAHGRTFDQERAIMVCIEREFAARVQVLEAESGAKAIRWTVERRCSISIARSASSPHRPRPPLALSA